MERGHSVRRRVQRAFIVKFQIVNMFKKANTEKVTLKQLADINNSGHIANRHRTKSDPGLDYMCSESSESDTEVSNGGVDVNQSETQSLTDSLLELSTKATIPEEASATKANPSLLSASRPAVLFPRDTVTRTTKNQDNLNLHGYPSQEDYKLQLKCDNVSHSTPLIHVTDTEVHSLDISSEAKGSSSGERKSCALNTTCVAGCIIVAVLVAIGIVVVVLINK